MVMIKSSWTYAATSRIQNYSGSVKRLSSEGIDRHTKSLFFLAWLITLEKELGTAEGIQQKLAIQANLSESSLSQYLCIARLFEKLKEVAPEEPFSKLKTWGVNMLYNLSELTNHAELKYVALSFETKFEVSAEEVRDTVHRLTDPTKDDFMLGEPCSDHKPDLPLPSVERPSELSKTLCLKSAKKVDSLATETQRLLNTLVQELVRDADRFSSYQVQETLTKILHALRKLKTHSNVLKQKMNIHTEQEGAQP
jgi:hypothetical protein